ncbi:ABC transporter permease [Christensenellaceae bacterium NSJ-63]|uniref:ABC transporter permease n=1 Tax=Guopingia tenuis TaxID=2763656 RepID=A0A926DHY8_9FIRM|nr:ABC transporter permease [Guopingia tenuis]
MMDPATIQMLLQGIVDTLYMTAVATLLAYIIGLPLGVIQVVTAKDGIKPNRFVYTVLNVIINIARSIPFLIFLVAILPFTRAIVGTSIGATATIVPLVVAAAPFIARLVESSIKEIDPGVIEAAQSMGASPMRIITHVMLPEARPSILVGSAIAITTILGYSSMAGFVGGGGLGDIAIRFGYYRYDNTIMLITVAILVIIVQIFQEVGMWIATKSDRRK